MDQTSRRAAIGMGLGVGGLLGFLGLAGRATAAPIPEGKKKAEGPAKAAEAAPSPPPAPAPAQGAPGTTATVNLSAVFKSVDKIRRQTEAYQKDVQEKRRDLEKMMLKMRKESENAAGLQPGSEAQENSQARIEKLKAEFEKARQKIQTEVSRRESEMYAQLYKEIQEAVAVVAKRRGVSLVLRTGDDPNPENPATVVAALQQPVIYADPAADLTGEVVALLNRAG